LNTVQGLCGIKATIVCDSISDAGVRITTMEIEYPRMVHSEFMTHRMFSRNAASSRAIPAAKMAEQLTARPVRFGKNVTGMQDAGGHEAFVEDTREAFDTVNGLCTPVYSPEEAWEKAREDAIYWSTQFAEAGYHKQVFNRLTEPFSMIKVVVTATEWENFYWLRDHSAADPTIAELARCMREAREQSTPTKLFCNHWHLPYLEFEWHEIDEDPSPQYLKQQFYIEGADGESVYISLEDAIKVSAARCAAVSFRNVDYGVEKSREVHARLVGDERKHASAMEHQATPMQEPYEAYYYPDSVNIPEYSASWEKGTSHADRNGNLWSGNFKGWLQYRKTILGENYTK
jgi:hypothetical protein